MAQQVIDTGTVADDGTGDDFRTVCTKANDNFTELYNALVGLLDFKGSTNASTNPNYPAALKGDAYVVSVAGKIGGASGANVDVGDVYVASADNAGGTQAAVGSSWFILEHNLSGALLSANNLSDVANASTARANLGLTIGTSGGTVPLLNGANTWSATQTFGAANFSGQITHTDTTTDSAFKLLIKGTAKGLRLGTDAAQARVEGVDNTGSGSFQPLFLNGSSVVIGVANAAVGTFSSIGIGVTGAIVASTYVKTTAKTVASLTSAGTAGAGARDFVTDATVAASGNFGAAVTGGGANKVPVYSDGAGWFIG
jgi:hypothetical protein